MLSKKIIGNLLLISLFLNNLTIILSQAPLVGDLPNYPYHGKMFSGYLDLSNPKKKLHYLFVLSQNDPTNDPVILWLNGGPGCSSLLGWAQEHGPAVFKPLSTEWELNEYSWNKNANVIYLESPAGVGFSTIESDDDMDWEVNDETSAQQNLEAVLDFFRRYPDYRRNPFYVSGESYAGIYVPFLASKINKYNESSAEIDKVKLKGILVGNGVTDWKVDTTPALIDFAYDHGIYSHELRNKYEKSCTPDPSTPECFEVLDKINASFETINIYDIYRDCVNIDNSTKDSKENFFKSINGKNKNDNYNKKTPWKYTPWVFNKNPKNINNDLKSLYTKNKKERESFEDDDNTTPPCTDAVGPNYFFNSNEVKAALYVPLNIKWGMCSAKVGAHYHVNEEKGSYFLYQDLIKSGIKIMKYSGDTDAAVPFTGTRKWIYNLKLETLKKWRSWKLNENDDKIAGYVVDYKGLTFVTVKGTGHMVPQWKRKEAFYMLTQFLNGKDL
jgi:serine carboxypeptidase-like clade 1